VTRRRIFKYEIDGIDFNLEMPRGSIILDVQYQESIGSAVLWAMFDESEKESIDRRFAVAPTGGIIFGEHDYVGTWQEGDLVWHLFEVNMDEVPLGE
jgi:hypothetical protein